MDDSNTTDSWSDFGLIYNKKYCLDDPENNTELCEKLQTVLFFITADYYTNKAFYPLTIIFVFIGTILNLYALYYFLKINRRNSQNIYLSTISICDTIGLHINFTLPIVRQSARFDDAFRCSIHLCRITGVLTEFFLIFPTWMILLLILERLVYTSRAVKASSSYAQKRAKVSIVILAIFVALLSLYRVLDLKGIDQNSVFSVLACSGTNRSLPVIRSVNLLMWITVPSFFILIMCLKMTYAMKLATRESQLNQSKTCPLKYNRTTKTVLYVSIFTLIFQAPIGIVNAFDIICAGREETLVFLTMFLSRKLTLMLYQISLCGKFFIYNQIFQDFKRILKVTMSRLTHRTNSAELGRPFLGYLQDCPSNRRIFFSSPRRLIVYSGDQRASLTKKGQKYTKDLNQRSTRTNGGYRPIYCHYDTRKYIDEYCSFFLQSYFNKYKPIY